RPPPSPSASSWAAAPGPEARRGRSAGPAGGAGPAASARSVRACGDSAASALVVRAGRGRRGLPSALVSDDRPDPTAQPAPAPSGTAPDAPTHWVLSLSCPDRPGIVHAVAGLLATHGGNITESQQFGDPLSGLFFMRVQVLTLATGDDLTAALEELADEFSMTWQLDVVGRPMRTLVMVSTAAHCLHDLLFRRQSEKLPVDIAAVVSNHTTLAPVAEFYGIPFHHVPVTRDTKPEAEARLMSLVEDLDVELVVLARYMQILSDELCRALAGRIINIHHSFLPSFKGARPYAQAHERGVKLIGATSHYVTGDL